MGRPREVESRGKLVLTSIFKTPISHRVHVAQENIEGDQQADLSVHGGPAKAVYAYPSEHYPFWRHELPDADLAWGAFGENFTTEGLLETEVAIGDRFRIGTAEFLVTQPRMPCYKLGVRFGRPDMVKRFHLSRRSGFYFAVAKEGEVTPGDTIEPLARDRQRLMVSDIVALYGADDKNQPLLEQASEHPALPESWREYFRQRRWGPDG